MEKREYWLNMYTQLGNYDHVDDNDAEDLELKIVKLYYK